jgi:predicted acylesterase/phospholipase RssA
METKISKPFTNIAISLSGGGYRATAFHLGALSYLHAAEYQGENLLKRLRILSTISGGTLTGIMYALYSAKAKPFEACYDKLYQLLEQDKLVEKAFEKLNNPRNWDDPNKSKDVINAFSEVYHSDFFDREHFKSLFESTSSHLTDVIFGSTEFTTGKQFRFTQNRGDGRFGNRDLNLPDSVAESVRLADAAAASSCFPGGFEPIVMAIDFSDSPTGPIATTWAEKGYQPTAIMDGGVIDNQGIEGVELAERRSYHRDDQPFIGTYIISDVSGRNMAPYEVPVFKNKWFQNFVTLRRVNWFAGILMAVLIGLLVFIKMPVFITALTASILTLGVAWFLLFFRLRSAIMEAMDRAFGNKKERRLFKDLKVIFKTPIYILIYLLKFRVTSVMKMVTDVFMKRIRTLQLDALYTDKHWNYRIQSNYIYTLYEDDKTVYEKLKKFGLGAMSDAMIDAIKTANSMPTTLWWSETEKANKMQQKLIACGQFSLCFNLIDYIENTVKKKPAVWDSLDTATKLAIEDLSQRFKADFKRFIQNPFWLVEENAKRLSV